MFSACRTRKCAGIHSVQYRLSTPIGWLHSIWALRLLKLFQQTYIQIWCDFDRASPLICGNKMPTRCNRGFYCRSYCLLNMFQAPLCPSPGAQEYYIVLAACGISCCGFQVAGLVWSWGLCARFAGCCSILRTGHITLSSTPDQLLEKPQHKIPHAATTV